MKIDELISTEPLTEAPVGTGKTLFTKAKTLIPGNIGLRAQGQQQTNKLANQLNKEFQVLVGQSGQIGQVTDDFLKNFLLRKGISTDQVNQIISGINTNSPTPAPTIGIQNMPAYQRQGKTLSSPAAPAPAPQATTFNTTGVAAQQLAARQAQQQQAVQQMKTTSAANQTAAAQQSAAEQAYQAAIAKPGFQRTAADIRAISTYNKSTGIAESTMVNETQNLSATQINSALIQAAQILSTSGVRAPATGTGNALWNLAKGVASAPGQLAGAARGGYLRGRELARAGLSQSSQISPDVFSQPSVTNTSHSTAVSNQELWDQINAIRAELRRRGAAR